MGKSDRFKPDLLIAEGYDFSECGFDAEAIEIPGHSKGSIGILTASGDLFANLNKPEIGSIIDDTVAVHASVKKLKCLQVNTVYPGHGQPFLMELFTKTH